MKNILDRHLLIVLGISFFIIVLLIAIKTASENSKLETEIKQLRTEFNHLRTELQECYRQQDLIHLTITQERGMFRFNRPYILGISVPIKGNNSITISFTGEILSYNITEKTNISYNTNNQITSIARETIGYNMHGRVNRVGNTSIDYDMRRRVSRIGNSSIGYDMSGRVNRVGNSSVGYDMSGNITRIN